VSCVVYLDSDSVSDKDGGGICGGPTLVSNQTLAGGSLADKGWLCYPSPGRVCIFDAKYLHGVLPGRGVPPGVQEQEQEEKKSKGKGKRRLTFMVGFWETISATYRGGEAGPAQPVPALSNSNSSSSSSGSSSGDTHAQRHEAWVKELGASKHKGAGAGAGAVVGALEVAPVPVEGAIWEPIENTGDEKEETKSLKWNNSTGSSSSSSSNSSSSNGLQLAMPSYEACFQGF
jgi:hypothetical protein